MDPSGSNSWGDFEPLKIWSRTGTVRLGLKVSELVVNGAIPGITVVPPTVNFRSPLALNKTFKLIFTSACPRPWTPGAPGLVRGRRLVSNIGLLTEETVVGSAIGAVLYLKMAELIPPAKPVVPKFGSARIQ